MKEILRNKVLFLNQVLHFILDMDMWMKVLNVWVMMWMIFNHLTGYIEGYHDKLNIKYLEYKDFCNCSIRKVSHHIQHRSSNPERLKEQNKQWAPNDGRKWHYYLQHFRSMFVTRYSILVFELLTAMKHSIQLYIGFNWSKLYYNCNIILIRFVIIFV